MITLKSIAGLLESRNLDFSIQGPAKAVRTLSAIDPGVTEALCYYVGDDPLALVGITDSIIFCMPGLEVDPSSHNTFIFTTHPQLCFYHSSSLFEERPPSGIHGGAIVDPSSQIGPGTAIGPLAVIEQSTIGSNVIIDSGVKIYKGTVIGNDVWIQSNTVIGATGVMWAWDPTGNKVLCAQTGNVIIEDGAFIGSNITIVKGAFENRPTIIGRDTMMAHGTMIGHGAIIGQRNHFANNVSIAGSVVSGENCFFGSGSIVRPHVTLQKGTIVGAGAVVVKDFLQEGLVLIGNPAHPAPAGTGKLAGVPAPLT